MFNAIKKKYTSERKAKQHEYQESLENIQRKNLKERTRVKRNTLKLSSSTLMSLKKSSTGQLKTPMSPKAQRPEKSSTSVIEEDDKQEGTSVITKFKDDPFASSVFEGSD